MKNVTQEVVQTQKPETPTIEQPPKSVVLAEKGVKSMSDQARLSLAVGCDIICGRLDPRIGTAATAAGRLAVQAFLARKRYGVADTKFNGRKEAYFCPEDEPAETVELEGASQPRRGPELTAEQRLDRLEAIMEHVAEKLERALPA